MLFLMFFFFFFFKQKTAYEMLRSLVGSEMCIRDSLTGWAAGVLAAQVKRLERSGAPAPALPARPGAARDAVAASPWSSGAMTAVPEETRPVGNDGRVRPRPTAGADHRPARAGRGRPADRRRGRLRGGRPGGEH